MKKPIEKNKKNRQKKNKTRKIMVDVKEHGGPCIHPIDVDRLLKRNSGKTRQVGCVKYEIRYLKTVLGVKDKRLIFGKKKI